MVEKALKLHEEIVNSLIEHNINPFERTYRSEYDPMLKEITSKSINELGGRMTSKHWREYIENKEILENRTNEMNKKLLKSSNSMSLMDKEKKKKKKELINNTQKSNNNNHKLKIQDVRQPAPIITYSFASPPSGFPLFDSHIIGPRNPVSKLVEDKTISSPEKLDQINTLAPLSSSSPLSSPSPLQSSLSPLRPKSTSKHKTLKPVINIVGDIGTVLPGGYITQGRCREVQRPPITVNATFPTTEELDGNRNPPGGQFGTAIRFPTYVESQGQAEVPIAQKVDSNKYKGRFSQDCRFSDQPTEQFNPSPGTYNIPRLYDHIKPRISHEKAEQLIQRIKNFKGLRQDPCHILSEKAVFGYGCNYDEHVKYGMCLDGQCARRAKWEDITLLLNDKRRVTGVKLVDDSVSSCTSISSDIPPDFSPLKSAALSGDIDTIIKLCTLGTDINQVDKEMDRCALHHCVSRNYLQLVNYLTGGSYQWKSNNPVEKPIFAVCKKLFKDVIQLNIRDRNGDTPLHLASRVGNQDIVEVLCDAGADGDTIRNNNNETAADIAKTQSIFQIIKMVSAKKEAEKELERLQQERIHQEKYRHRLTSTPPSRPGSRSTRVSKNSSPSPTPSHSRNNTKNKNEVEFLTKSNHENELELNDEDEDHNNHPKQIMHSYMIGYLPPEKEPPPFKGNFKKKIPKIE